jgi:hypothetical protein
MVFLGIFLLPISRPFSSAAKTWKMFLAMSKPTQYAIFTAPLHIWHSPTDDAVCVLRITHRKGDMGRVYPINRMNGVTA